ncbi:GPI mannosyltransferase 3-like isoform X1 [Periplaneta americana]|uniref:GPI mannosyltransferase 3-like isoform X1 n=1 Tax=Periplaneta americana TaxID=6978 RepID=UPI0037E73604
MVMKSWQVFVFIRLCTVWLVQTWFVPDEYWQSVEVAHKLVFGYGHLTWEWSHGIRSYIYPVFLASVLQLLKTLNLDTTTAVIYAPRVLQALVTSIGDICLWNWFRRHNMGRGSWMMFAVLTNWFWLYCGSRTLINSFEASLNTIALNLFPWNRNKLYKSSSKFLWFVGITCAIRPTAAITWLPLCIYHFATSHTRKSVLLEMYIPIGITLTIFSIMLDSYCYGRFIFTPLRFLQANIMEGVNEFYGSHPYFWYFSAGIPVVLGLHLVPFIFGAYKALKQNRGSVEKILLFVIVWTVAVLSAVPHKEFRFLLPLMPMFVYIEVGWLSEWSRKTSKLLIWFVTIILAVGNFALLGYFGLVHQRGTVDVMSALAQQDPQHTSVLFLMPCHSTPLYSHLHAKIRVRFLTCEPDFTGNPLYLDEADIFYRNPEKWLLQNFPDNVSISHVVMYDILYPKIKNFLTQNNYTLNSSFFHTLHPNGRIGEHVQIYTR